MAVADSIAHNFAHQFLRFRDGFLFSHLSRKAIEKGIDSVMIDLLGRTIHPSTLDTPVFRHVIMDLQSCFYTCLDSQSLHRDIVQAEIFIDPADFPRPRCVCTLRDRRL
jgi:hypothetical protein